MCHRIRIGPDTIQVFPISVVEQGLEDFGFEADSLWAGCWVPNSQAPDDAWGRSFPHRVGFIGDPIHSGNSALPGAAMEAKFQPYSNGRWRQ